MQNKPLAVYIHFPYCKSRCPYCDFFRALKPKNDDETILLDRYKQDIRYFADLLGERLVTSIFFGGGTPSLLSADAVRQILDEISRAFVVSADAEISLEANPNTFDRDKFVSFHDAGINRLSLGVQALNSDDLKFLGRTHSLDDALAAMELVVNTFEKSSVDLIYARPNQNFYSWQNEIDTALSFGLKHISLYQLTIEEGTVFYKKNVAPLDEENAANLYEQTVSYLRSRGFSRYEVSNFAASPADESRHNLVYWQGGDYIGIGDGAHGRFLHDGKIFASVDGKISETLTPLERSEELLIMGLRIKSGINFERFFQASGIHFFDFVNNLAIKKLAKLNLLCYDDANVWLTDKGFLLLDKVILELVS